MPLLYNKA